MHVSAVLIAGGEQESDPFLERIGDARMMLIDAALHGLHDSMGCAPPLAVG